MRRSLIEVTCLTFLLLAGCVAPMTPSPPADTVATEAAIAAKVLATLTAAAPAAGPLPSVAPTGELPVTAAPTSFTSFTCNVAVDGLSLRSGPGTAYAPPLRALPAGTLLIPLAYVPVGDPDGTWLEVRLAEGAGMGWVAAGSVTCNVDPASLPQAPLPSKITATSSPTATRKPAPKVTVTPTSTASAVPSPTPTLTATVQPPLAQVTLQDAYPSGMAVDPERGNVFVAGRNTNLIYVLDRSLKVIKKIPVGKQPCGVTYFNGYIHVANFGSGSLTVIDAQTLEPVSNPPGRGPTAETASIQNEVSQPTFIAVDPLRGRVLVALHGPQEVYHRYVYLYGVQSDGSLGQWGSVNDLPGGAYGIAALPSLARAYTSHRDTFSLMAVDTETATAVEAESLHNLPFSPYLVAALDATKTIYVTHNTPGQPADAPDQISQYLVAAGAAPKWMKTVTVGELGPGGGAIAIYPWREDMWRLGSPYDGSVWVGTRDKVTVFDPTLVEQRIFGPADGIVGQPSAIVADPVLRRVYVAEGETGRIMVLSGW